MINNVNNEEWDGKERRRKYAGEERRQEFCPVHHIKCEEIRLAHVESKKKVPIWVFTIFVTSMFLALGWINLESRLETQKSNELLQKHLTSSSIMFERTDAVLSRATHALNEVAFNQRTVMKNLKLDFQAIPDYGPDFK